MGIKAKILMPTIVLIIVVSVAVLSSNIALFAGFVESSTLTEVDSATKVAVNNLNFLKSEAKAAALSIAKDPVIIRAIEDNNREELIVRARSLQQEADVEFCTITDRFGNVILRTHAPDQYGDSLASQANIQAAIYGETLTTIEAGTVVRLSVRSGTPVFDNDNNVIGVISAGYRLDTRRFVDSIKTMVGCEISVVLGDDRIATTVLQEDGTRAIGTKADPLIVQKVQTDGFYSGKVSILNRPTVCNYIPIRGPDEQMIGMIFIGQYIDEGTATIHAFIQSGLGIMFLVLLISVIILFILVEHIVSPIRAMTKAASALAVGDTELEIQVNTHDEMRILANAFNSMIDNTRQQVQAIEHIANGDLTVSLHTRSEKDIMNLMLEKLNSTIKAQALALKKEYERVKLMLDTIPLASRLWNRDLKLIECNDAVVNIFRLKNKADYIEQYFDLIPEYQPNGQKSSEKAKAMIHEAFEKGTYKGEFTYSMPDGSPIPTEITMVRLPFGDEDVVAAYSRDLREQVKMMSDITYRDHLRQIINDVADVLLRTDPENFSQTLQQCMGTMAHAVAADRMHIFKNFTENGKLCCTQLYEWSEGAYRFQDINITTNVSYDDRIPETKKVLMRGDCIHRLIRDMPDSDHAQFHEQGILVVLIIPILLHNEFWGFVGFDRIIKEEMFSETEEAIIRSGSLLAGNALLRNEYVTSIQDTSSELANALEEAKQANNAKSDFLAKMSHEMRTPLNAIIGLSEIALSSDDIDKEAKLNLEKIYNSGSTLLSIVNDILDISKIQSGKFVIMPHEYDMPSLINDSILQNILRIGSRPIRFVLNIDDDMPARLYGDELRIKQIINNLLSNAFKYTENGKVDLMLRCEKDGDAVHMTIRVSDTGFGIRPENLEHLFDDYEQFGATSRDQVSGSGLGLAITKKLSEMMDGTIDVESVYGVGSVFTVRIRQGYVSDAVLGVDVARDLKNLQYSANKLNRNMHTKRIQLAYARILLVDDNMTNLDVTKGLLKPYGMQVDCVMSGQEAINAVREEKVIYNAIFMDHMMPKMDGIEATQIIRENIGTQYARTVPIIALTANAIVGSEEMFLSRGFQAFISKPIDIIKLDQVLNRWVRDKSIEGELSYITEEGHHGNEAEKLFITINNIDMHKALERFSGDEAVILDVLRSYTTSTRPLLSRLGAAIATEDFEDYAIAIHGIKGASYSICAQKAGVAAELLETAAKTGDFNAVKAGHTAFKKLVEALLNDIDQALHHINSASTHKPLYFTAPEAEILIVEDNETSRKAIIGQIKPLMLQIDTANNGKEALWMIRKKHYHLIFMDYVMPVMDGIEAVTRLRQMKGEYYKNVPVIALTAYDTDDIKESFLKAGMNDFLTKPVEIADIYEKIEHWLPEELLREHQIAVSDVQTEDQEDLPVIEGINNQEGIRYSGTKALFISLLGDFYKLIDLKATKIEQYLAEGLIKEVTIEAHALKNTARMIGAEALSEGFARLEHYGDEGNIQSLEQETSDVLEQYRRFKLILKPFGELAELEKRSASMEELTLLLKELILAMDRFNIDAADMIFKQLEELRIPAECQTHMDMLRAFIADVAIEEAMKSVDAMIEIIEKLSEDME